MTQKRSVPGLKSHRRRAIHLVELLIVIIIVGIIASIAVPRSSKGSHVIHESALRTNLALLRSAIEEYAGDHGGAYPGTLVDGTPATPSLFVSHLTQYSSIDGSVSEIRNERHIFGPYLQHGIPPMPVGLNRGSNKVMFDTVNLLPRVDVTIGVGWIYNPLTGDLIANSASRDQNGRLYSDY
jgi:type II secretory pathway pseudopilin PulG